MASIKQKTERKFKITVCNGYGRKGKKIAKAKTITVPETVAKKRILQYVQQQAAEMEREFQLGYSEDADTPFETYARKWLARQVKYKESTLAGYRSMLGKIYPLIGQVSICKIRPITLENMLMELRKRKHRGKLIGEQTVKKYLMTVSSVLEDAKNNGIIRHNPVRSIELCPIVKKEVHIPLGDELKRLVDIILTDDEPFRTYYLLAMFTGCRKGELCALRWMDIRNEGFCK